MPEFTLFERQRGLLIPAELPHALDTAGLLRLLQPVSFNPPSPKRTPAKSSVGFLNKGLVHPLIRSRGALNIFMSDTSKIRNRVDKI